MIIVLLLLVFALALLWLGASLQAPLFGALYQGGAELAFEVPRVSREIVVVIQGLVILFAGALEFLFVPLLRPLLRPA